MKAVNNKWIKLLARNDADLTTVSAIDPVFFDLMRQFTKDKKEHFFTLYKERGFAHFINVDPLIWGRFFYQKDFNRPEKVKKYYFKGLRLLQKTKKLIDYYGENLTCRSSLQDWQKAYRDFKTGYRKINYGFSIMPWLAIEHWQSEFKKILSQLIKRNNLKAMEDQIFVSATQHWKKTALIEIQEKLKRGVSLEKIIKDYQFLRSWTVVFYHPLDKKWLHELKVSKKESQKIKIFSQTQLFKLLKPKGREKEILENAPYIIFFKDWRDDVRRKFAYYWSFFFELLCEKFQLQDLDIGFLTLDEIEESLKQGQVDKKKIEQRKRHPFVITNRKEGIEIEIKENKISRYLLIIKGVEESSKKRAIYGVAAQLGRVRGSVFIIKTFRDIKRIKNGDILVADTTHPNYLPAMKKASAFVTNEGGIISHTAIVARELKKPCIVGTRIATRVLKDGDLVEVDANKGVVKILKKFK